MTGRRRYLEVLLTIVMVGALLISVTTVPSVVLSQTSVPGDLPGANIKSASRNALPSRRRVHFVPNSFRFWNNPKHATTELPPDCSGSACTPIPAYADILLKGSNFVQCKGGPFALCYYSGPNDGAVDLSCEPRPDGKFANCNCYKIPFGTYFVDINAILNYKVYSKTVATCGKNGERCLGQVNKAPVCSDINKQQLIPGADFVSTFSFDCVPTNGIGQTNCTEAEPYAGCMTAPCYRTPDTAKNGIVKCSCPIFKGPYQVGQSNQQCTLEDDLVWSAAYNPNVTGTTPTPPPGECFPDAPGSLGCPLLGPPPYQPPAGIDCKKVCQEYHTCRSSFGIEAGYTCDATLCTGQCNDRNLVSRACSGLTNNGHLASVCDLREITKTETAAGCSCCASQLCGCDANARTEHAIFDLNAAQRDRGITPQCDQNGTLCGQPR